jgi:uncharacterized protein (DUF305 family)
MAHGSMAGMSMKNTPANPYSASEMRMHDQMMRATGSNADETWARKMIEHHQGAIEMNRILMSKGSDRELKAMARKTTAEQQKEIAQLQSWLRRHGRR